MSSVRGKVGSQDQHGKLLKGSDVVAVGKQYIGGVILQVRESPAGFGSPWIVDFDTEVLPGISSWPCNVTESRRIAAQISDNTEDWEEWGLLLVVETKNNPKANAGRGALVPGLAMYSVEKPEKVKKTRKKPATIKKGHKDGPAPFGPTTEECPF